MLLERSATQPQSAYLNYRKSLQVCPLLLQMCHLFPADDSQPDASDPPSPVQSYSSYSLCWSTHFMPQAVDLLLTLCRGVRHSAKLQMHAKITGDFWSVLIQIEGDWLTSSNSTDWFRYGTLCLIFVFYIAFWMSLMMRIRKASRFNWGRLEKEAVEEEQEESERVLSKCYTIIMSRLLWIRSGGHL